MDARPIRLRGKRQPVTILLPFQTSLLGERKRSSSALPNTKCRNPGTRRISPRPTNLRTVTDDRPPKYSQASWSLNAPRSDSGMTFVFCALALTLTFLFRSLIVAMRTH
jgi:hypothetical protein